MLVIKLPINEKNEKEKKILQQKQGENQKCMYIVKLQS